MIIICPPFFVVMLVFLGNEVLSFRLKSLITEPLNKVMYKIPLALPIYIYKVVIFCCVSYSDQFHGYDFGLSR